MPVFTDRVNPLNLRVSTQVSVVRTLTESESSSDYDTSFSA